MHSTCLSHLLENEFLKSFKLFLTYKMLRDGNNYSEMCDTAKKQKSYVVFMRKLHSH